MAAGANTMAQIAKNQPHDRGHMQASAQEWYDGIIKDMNLKRYGGQ